MLNDHITSLHFTSHVQLGAVWNRSARPALPASLLFINQWDSLPGLSLTNQSARLFLSENMAPCFVWFPSAASGFFPSFHLFYGQTNRICCTLEMQSSRVFLTIRKWAPKTAGMCCFFAVCGVGFRLQPEQEPVLCECTKLGPALTLTSGYNVSQCVLNRLRFAE